jgi:Glycosyl transferase family 2
MKLVMTLRTRDEADVVDAHIAFHLNAGVDFVIVTDHRSNDGTVDILEDYARQRYLHLIREQGDVMDEGAWATRMSRLAATEFGADWVIPSDADEFWWPRGGSLKEVLGSVPDRYGIVRALLRQFVPQPDNGAFFAERMTARVATVAPIHDPTSLFRPNLKSIHRADPKVKVSAGAHTLQDTQFVPLRGWYPIEFLHFPIRSFEQCERKYRHLQSSLGTRRNAYYEDVHRALEAGTFRQFYETLVLDDAALERGLGDGSLVIDTRLCDVLRGIRSARNGGFSLPGVVFPRPTVVDEAAYAVEVAAAGEADVVRVQRRLDELEQRVAAVEGGLAARIARRFAR